MSQENSSEDRDKQLSEVEKSMTKEDPPPTLMVWAIRGVSFLALLLMTSYVVWNSFQPVIEPIFLFEVKMDQIRTGQNGYVVPIKVTNDSNSSVQSMQLMATLVNAQDSIIEEKELPFALIGQKESREAEYWFKENPRNYKVQVNVTGYQLP